MDEQQTNPTPGDSGSLTETATQAGDSDVAAVRELITKAHPDVVPELIVGSSFDELMASVPGSQAAYKRIVESVQASASPVSVTPSAVPAGGGARREFVINVEELSPSAKIAEGLRQRNARKS